jgi:hypothetical protein
VSPFRQGHKTDQNDALAVAEAARRPNLKEAPLKSLDQQALQAIQRSREMLIRDRTAISNHIRGLLLEFGIAIRKGFAHLHRHVPEILEDAENGVPHNFRSTLHLMHRRLLEIKQDIDVLTDKIEGLVFARPGESIYKAVAGLSPIARKPGAVKLTGTTRYHGLGASCGGEKSCRIYAWGSQREQTIFSFRSDCAGFRRLLGRLLRSAIGTGSALPH